LKQTETLEQSQSTDNEHHQGCQIKNGGIFWEKE
jgi:hypothetical protein